VKQSSKTLSEIYSEGRAAGSAQKELEFVSWTNPYTIEDENLAFFCGWIDGLVENSLDQIPSLELNHDLEVPLRGELDQGTGNL